MTLFFDFSLFSYSEQVGLTLSQPQVYYIFESTLHWTTHIHSVHKKAQNAGYTADNIHV